MLSVFEPFTGNPGLGKQLDLTQPKLDAGHKNLAQSELYLFSKLV